MKKQPLKVAHNWPNYFFQFCKPAQNQPKSHILFHKNGSLRNFYTMNLNEGVQICSIAASTFLKERRFKSFLTPTCNFQSGATKINGMKFINGKLYKHNQPVQNAVKIKKGLQNFLEWLSDLLNDKRVDQIVLVRNIFLIQVCSLFFIYKAI